MVDWTPLSFLLGSLGPGTARVFLLLLRILTACTLCVLSYIVAYLEFLDGIWCGSMAPPPGPGAARHARCPFGSQLWTLPAHRSGACLPTSSNAVVLARVQFRGAPRLLSACDVIKVPDQTRRPTDGHKTCAGCDVQFASLQNNVPIAQCLWVPFAHAWMDDAASSNCSQSLRGE